MFEVFLVVCIQGAACMRAEDELGPYQSAKECEVRLEQLSGDPEVMGYAIRTLMQTGAQGPLVMAKKCQEVPAA